MEKQDNCKNCLSPISSDYSFCPYCGEPLNDLAKQIVKKQNSIAQLRLIYVLLEKVEDEKTKKMLNKLIEKYKSDND
jgi:predicted amidophosphoribosyltransferase